MARNEDETAREARVRNSAETGDGAHNEGAGAEAGADYDAAYAHAVAGRSTEAEAICRKILADDPTHAEALHLLGGIAAQGGNAPTAIELFNRALEAKPDFAKAHSNLGALLLDRDEAEAALNHLEKAIELDPNLATAHNNLGNALMRSGRFGDAEQAFARVVQLEPENELAYNNLGAALLRQGRADEAIARFEKAIELDPDLAVAYNNLGKALKKRGDFEGAAASYRRAVELSLDHAEMLSSIGRGYRSLGKLDEALACHQKALAVKPDLHLADFRRSIGLLLQGKFEEGWEAHLWRSSVRAQAGELYRRPLARDLSGEHIFLCRDQGLGDEIFFLRFAPELKRRGAAITYWAGVKVASIVARLPFLDAVVGEDAAPGASDMYLSVGDLPYLLGMKSAADIPPPLALEPLPERVEATAAKLAALGPAPYIGVTWRAGTGLRDEDPPQSQLPLAGTFKQISLARLAATLRPVEATFLALQRLPQEDEVDELARAVGRPVHDFSALNDDLEDMLALLALIDEYVTVSNANVHLRAGTGRTSRVLVPTPPQYRWMAEGEESPWFPGCGVYRQKLDGSWQEALAALARDLEEAFGGPGE